MNPWDLYIFPYSLGWLYDCPNVSDVTLDEMGKFGLYQTTTQCKKRGLCEYFGGCIINIIVAHCFEIGTKSLAVFILYIVSVFCCGYIVMFWWSHVLYQHILLATGEEYVVLHVYGCKLDILGRIHSYVSWCFIEIRMRNYTATESNKLMSLNYIKCYVVMRTDKHIKHSYFIGKTCKL